MRPDVTYANPSVVAAPLGAYSHVSRGAGLLHVAGQVGVDVAGELVGGDVTSQTRQTYRNLEAILASQDLGMSAVLRFTTYLIDADDLPAFSRARAERFAELFPDGGYPPNTLLVVSGLAQPELRVEIEAVAALPAGQ